MPNSYLCAGCTVPASHGVDVIEDDLIFSAMSLAVKVWFVTGASTGFGRAVTEHALRQGDSVVATPRHPEVLSDLLSKYSSQLLLLSLDVRDPEKIRAAFNDAVQQFGRVDIVLNHAEFCIVREAEDVCEERGRELFEALFWGPANVSKEAVKVFRERNNPPGGRLLQISSQTTLQVLPGVAHYAAAKAALECLSEGMAAELDPAWNIKVSVIQPALFRTNEVWGVDTTHAARGEHSLLSEKPRRRELDEHIRDGDPVKFARAMYRVASMDDPPLYVPLHRVAVEAAKARGERLIQTAEEYASWSENVYYRVGLN